MRGVAIACLIAACGGGGGGTAAVKKPVVGPAVDEKTAERDAKGLAEELVQTLGHGSKDSLFSLLEDSLIVFGPHRTDAAANRTDALVALGQVIDPKAKKKPALRSTALEVVASNGGRSAWAFDVVDIDGTPHAITAILVNTNDLWQVEAANVAFTPARSAIKAELAKDAIVPPGAVAKSKIAPEAKGAVDRFQKGLLDQELWGTDLAARGDAMFIGPAAGEVTRGKKDLKALWKKRADAKTRAVTSGDITAAVTQDGQLAWVSAPITEVAEGEGPTPLRAFAVFEKAGAEWKMIALHESVAIDQPGSGVAFKKVLPPAPKEVVVEAKVEPKVEKKPEKVEKKVAKKVAKKKKQAADEDDPPKKVVKKKKPADDDDDPPKKVVKKKKPADDDDDPPKKLKKGKKPPVESDDPPKKLKKKKPPADNDDVIIDDDDAPKKKKKRLRPSDQ